MSTDLPSNFRPGPQHAPIQPRPLLRIEPAVYNPTDHIPPPPPGATLRVNSAGRIYLHFQICQQLGLSPYQPIDLLQPANGSVFWHLDLRPTAQNRINWYTYSRPRAKMSRSPAAGLIQAGTLLTLRLLAGVPAYPGFYPLIAE